MVRYYKKTRYTGSYRTNFGKPLLEKRAQERLLASNENLNDVIRESVLEMLPVTNEQILEDNTYMNVIDSLQWCGLNKRLGLLEYITEEQEFGTRFIEFYSFRKTLAGNILVYGWSIKSNEIRSYRLDRVITFTPTRLPFDPRYEIEIMI